MSISDYFTCTEIGGLTEVTYHNIYFKNYYFKELDGKKYIFPSIDIDANFSSFHQEFHLIYKTN